MSDIEEYLAVLDSYEVGKEEELKVQLRAKMLEDFKGIQGFGLSQIMLIERVASAYVRDRELDLSPADGVWYAIRDRKSQLARLFQQLGQERRSLLRASELRRSFIQRIIIILQDELTDEVLLAKIVTRLKASAASRDNDQP